MHCACIYHDIGKITHSSVYKHEMLVDDLLVFYHSSQGSIPFCSCTYLWNASSMHHMPRLPLCIVTLHCYRTRVRTTDGAMHVAYVLLGIPLTQACHEFQPSHCWESFTHCAHGL